MLEVWLVKSHSCLLRLCQQRLLCIKVHDAPQFVFVQIVPAVSAGLYDTRAVPFRNIYGHLNIGRVLFASVQLFFKPTLLARFAIFRLVLILLTVPIFR